MSGVVRSVRDDMYCQSGYSRDCPFGCVDQGLMSVLYFLPGQAMRTHRHLDSDEYFTSAQGDAEMYVNGRLVPLPEGHTFLRCRGMLHALRNASDKPLVIYSFQSPIPAEEMTRWESVEEWGAPEENSCPRCWCGQQENGACVNCGAPLHRIRSRSERQAG